MRISMWVNKAAALLAGSDVHGRVTITVPAGDLTETERRQLVRFGREGTDADYLLDGYNVKVAVANRETLGRVLAALQEEADAKEAQEKAEREELVRKWLSAPLDEFLTERWNNERPSHAVYKLRERTNGTQCWMIPNDPRLDARVASAEALAVRKTEAAKAEAIQKFEQTKAEEAAEKAAKAAALGKLRTWANANGSELLRARMEDGFEWAALARDEYVEQATAKVDLPTPLDDFDESKEKDRTCPEWGEIRALRRVRELVPDARASIRWVEYDGDEGRPEIKVTVTTPDGVEKDVWFGVP